MRGDWNQASVSVRVWANPLALPYLNVRSVREERRDWPLI